MRLMYVGCTRAREQLFICYAPSYKTNETFEAAVMKKCLLAESVGDSSRLTQLVTDCKSMLDWLTVYDQVLDGSALIMEDGTQVKLNPSETTPYENGVVTLYSRLPSTIDLRKVDAISITGQEVSISNPFQSTEEPSS